MSLRASTFLCFHSIRLRLSAQTAAKTLLSLRERRTVFLTQVKLSFHSSQTMISLEWAILSPVSRCVFIHLVLAPFGSLMSGHRGDIFGFSQQSECIWEYRRNSRNTLSLQKIYVLLQRLHTKPRLWAELTRVETYI